MKGVVFVAIAVFVAFAKCTPIEVPEPATELLPPKIDAEQSFFNEPTLATDLVPPALPSEQDDKLAMLFLINIFAVKNETANDSSEVLHDGVPFYSEPLTMFLLVVEDDNETNPVSLDEVAKDLEAEGFKIEKVMNDGVTSLIKVDLSSLGIENDEENDVNTDEKFIKSGESLESEASVLVPATAPNQLTKIRRKRTLCLKCIKSFDGGHGGHGGFGGFGGGHGGHGGFGGFEGGHGHGHGHGHGLGGGIGIVPVVVVPVPVGSGGGHHHHHHGGHGHQGGFGGGYGGGYAGGHGGNGGFQQQPQYYPQNGGGNSYSQAYAQASAQSSSGSWKRK